MLKYYFKLGLE